MTPTLSPEPDDREMTIFAVALTLPDEQRELFVQSACLESPELLERVRRRLEWERRMNGFLLEPLFPDPEQREAFAPGDRIADRFEIRRKIAEGGMAAVYEAYDRKWERRVALKCPKPAFRGRILPELRSALQVTHPNICRVYEVHAAQTPHGEVEFLAMEFLEGETLAEHLRRQPGWWSSAIAHRLALQLCAGLAEAHSRNIIHGDLKPGNIIITGSPPAELQAVITDFGLARVMGSGEFGPILYSLRGTPGYVAPEVLRGQPPSKASDIYALGVILYQMFTRTRPPSDVSLALGTDDETGVMPASAPPEWIRTARACLANAAEDRLSDAAAVASGLPALPAAGRSHWLSVVLAILVLAIAAAAFVHTRSAPPAPRSIRLAILPPQSDGPASVAADGTAQDLSVRLHAAGGRHRPFVVISVAQANRLHLHSAAASGRLVGATHALETNWRKEADHFVIAAALYDAARDTVLGRFEITLDAAHLGSLPASLASRIGAELGISLSADDVGGPIPDYLDYVQGLYHVRHTSNPQLARVAFQRASEAAGNAVWPRLGLAETELLEYSRNHNQQALGRACSYIETSGALTVQDSGVAVAVAGLLVTAGELNQAVSEYRRALALAPLNSSALHGLGNTLARLNRDREAIAALRQAVDAEPDSYQPLVELGTLLFYRGRYAEAAEQFAKASALAPDMARLHHNLAAVLADLSEYARAEQEYHRALSLDRTRDTLAGLGALFAYENRHAESVYYYEQAVATGPEDSLITSNLADSYRRTGHQSEAIRTYHRALETGKRTLAANPTDPTELGNVAYICSRLGRRSEALADIEQALRLAPNDIKVRRRAVTIYEVLGDRDTAFHHLALAPIRLVTELSRQPDLADFRRDPRFTQLKAEAEKKQQP